jgi:V/A-type H+-transporting ATPase subunit D
MELMRLRRRLKLSVKGHKLLKDKLDELTRVFLEMLGQNRGLRAECERMFALSRDLLVAAYALGDAAVLDRVLAAPGCEGGAAGDGAVDGAVGEPGGVAAARAPLFRAGVRRILNTEVTTVEDVTVTVPDDYSRAMTPTVLDEALARRADAIRGLLRLSEQEHILRMLALEIRDTRRRVNALEYVLIPDLERDIARIVFKLDEADRESRTRLLKVKEILA